PDSASGAGWGVGFREVDSPPQATMRISATASRTARGRCLAPRIRWAPALRPPALKSLALKPQALVGDKIAALERPRSSRNEKAPTGGRGDVRFNTFLPSGGSTCSVPGPVSWLANHPTPGAFPAHVGQWLDVGFRPRSQWRGRSGLSPLSLPVPLSSASALVSATLVDTIATGATWGRP